jgi:hypothetical protein
LQENFSGGRGVVFRRFAGIFEGCFTKDGCLDVVFGRCQRGGMRGERGGLAVTFQVRKMRHPFEVFF